MPLDTVQLALKRYDPKLTSPTVPLLSGRDPALLKRIAELYCRFVLTPRLVEEWSKPRRPAARHAGAPEPSAAGPFHSTPRLGKRAGAVPAELRIDFR